MTQNNVQVSTISFTGESAKEDHMYHEAHISEQHSSKTTTVGEVLSVTQLVLRRGFALLVMVSILVAGILASTFLTRLLK